MTTVLKEAPTISTLVMDSITHRLRMLSKETGDPALIFIDETEPMLANKDFAMNFVKSGCRRAEKPARPISSPSGAPRRKSRPACPN